MVINKKKYAFTFLLFFFVTISISTVSSLLLECENDCLKDSYCSNGLQCAIEHKNELKILGWHQRAAYCAKNRNTKQRHFCYNPNKDVLSNRTKFGVFELYDAVDDYFKSKKPSKSYSYIKYGSIQLWDVSEVIDFYAIFFGLSLKFDPYRDFSTIDSLINWDTSKATSMEYMFEKSIFNADISTWNVSNVIDMYGMFCDATFIGNISNWDVSNVEDMSHMFEGTSNTPDLSKWNTSNVKDVFIDTGIELWDLPNVEHMSYMFSNVTSWGSENGKINLSK